MPRKVKSGDTPIGQRIKAARLKKEITLEEIANETGFSIDDLKKFEAGKKIPPVGAILQISRALKVDSGMLLKDQEASLEARIKAYTKRTDNYAYTTLTPGAENKHIKAFRVSIEPLKEHQGVGYCHEGEEFVYVLKGTVEVGVGQHVNTLRENDSLHFNSGIQHFLRNIGRDPAELIVVIYSP